MTKKQKLIQEYIELAKRFHKFDPDFVNNGPEFQMAYLSNKKIAELLSMIGYMHTTIAKREAQEKVDAYFATEDGAKLKEALLTSIERKKNKYSEVINSNENTLIEKLHNKLGNHWTLILNHGVSRASIEIGLKNDDKTRPNMTFKFGHTFTIYIDKKWHTDENYTTQINYGSMGAFDTETDKQRIDFLNGLAKISGDSIFLEDVKETVIEMLEICKEIGKEMSYYQNKLKNPFND